VAASNQDLKQLITERAFREDLFYRLNVVPIHVPPLRERKEDIPILIEHFLAKYNQAFQRQIQGFTPAAVAALGNYHWPGNVRELENVIERLVAISPQGILGLEDLPLDTVMDRDKAVDDIFSRGVSLREAKADFERHYILRALEKSRWNQTEAAKMLGVHRNTLLGKMESLHIRPTSETDAVVSAHAS
jgi:two-component system response regulator AtoC